MAENTNNNPIAAVLKQVSEMIAGLSLMRKITMVIVLTISITGIFYMLKISNQASMEPLFTNLNSQDIGTILTELDKDGIKYEVDQDHRSILVPSSDVLNVRLKLAEAGLPRFGGVGFEIFDKQGFGLSDFEQRVNYQRALEGELARTMINMKEVESARVHLVLPEKTIFSESTQQATASVIVKLGRSGTLDRNKVNAITHLVASAVEGLDPEQVTVVDTEGRLLSAPKGDSDFADGERSLDQKIQTERAVERQIVDLVSPVVGVGKVVARVSAQIDFTRVETTDEIVDPTKSAVVSEARTTGKKTGAAEGGSTGENSDDSSEQFSYEVSKSLKKQVIPMGGLKQLSVAVLVDGTYVDKDGVRTYQPRTPEDLKKIEELVKNAIGFKADRGDQLKVENMAFQNPEAEMAQAEKWYESRTTYGFMISVIGNILVVVMGLLVYMFVIRPMMKSWKLAKQGGEVPLLPGDSKADVSNLIRTDPMAAVNAIRQWLK